MSIGIPWYKDANTIVELDSFSNTKIQDIFVGNQDKIMLYSMNWSLSICGTEHEGHSSEISIVLVLQRYGDQLSELLINPDQYYNHLNTISYLKDGISQAPPYKQKSTVIEYYRFRSPGPSWSQQVKFGYENGSYPGPIQLNKGDKIVLLLNSTTTSTTSQKPSASVRGSICSQFGLIER